MESLFWDASILATPLIRGNRFWSPKNVITLFNTYTEGTPPFRGTGHYFWVSKPFRGHLLARKKWMTTKAVDKFNWTLVPMTTAFTKSTISYKSMYSVLYLWKVKHNIAEISRSPIFLYLQSNPAISNSVNSKSPLFRRKIECPWIYPSPLRFPGYFEAPLFRTFFHFPWDFEIAGFDGILSSCLK